MIACRSRSRSRFVFGSERSTPADWVDGVETGWTEQKSQGTACDLKGPNPSPCQGEDRGFESRLPLHRSRSDPLFYPEHARVLGCSGLNPSNRDREPFGLSLRARIGR